MGESFAREDRRLAGPALKAFTQIALWNWRSLSWKRALPTSVGLKP